MGKGPTYMLLPLLNPKTTEMKQFVTLFLSVILSVATAHAQSFLDRLQRQAPNQGKITVTQSADIDELVNGTKGGAATQTATKKQAESRPANRSAAKTGEQAKAEKPAQHSASGSATKRTPTEQKKADDNAETETRTVDTRPKVMENSRKVNGYRVQAFAGGNTRADKQKAQRIGNDIKMNFPNEPVYVHFYSPRWICRVGNYRTYEEAHRMLLEIRELGYKQALIVKGKITIQY